MQCKQCQCGEPLIAIKCMNGSLIWVESIIIPVEIIDEDIVNGDPLYYQNHKCTTQGSNKPGDFDDWLHGEW